MGSEMCIRDRVCLAYSAEDGWCVSVERHLVDTSFLCLSGRSFAYCLGLLSAFEDVAFFEDVAYAVANTRSRTYAVASTYADA